MKALGDVNNGNHPVGISFDESVAAGKSATMAYIVMNTGKPSGGVINFFQNFAWSIGALGEQNWAGLLAGGCDGLVAKGSHTYSAAQLATLTAGGKTISGHDYTPGTDSPAGCGSNSRYWVDWTISAK